MNLEDFKKELDEKLSSMTDAEILSHFPGYIIVKKDEPEYYDGDDLWDADPNCKHVLDPECYSGIRCLKCRGWCCL